MYTLLAEQPYLTVLLVPLLYMIRWADAMGMVIFVWLKVDHRFHRAERATSTPLFANIALEFITRNHTHL